MARSPFTLAALATAAVAGIDVTGAERLGSGPVGDFDQAVLDLRDGGRAVIRVPRGARIAARATADLAAVTALTTGVRARLPFDVPTLLGTAPVGPTRAIVYDFLPGSPVELDRLRADSALPASIGTAIAAIHSLPTSLVTDAQLPFTRPIDTLATTTAVIDEATATGLVPAALVERWQNAAQDPALWQFAPSVVNGAMSADTVLEAHGEVTGIVDWYALGAGDPARDLFWVLGASQPDAADAVFDAYLQSRGASDRQVRKRATLYAELEIAKWLLHGTRERSTEIVDDAVGMLHNLVDIVQHDLNRSIDTNTRPVMTVAEVEDMLDREERSS